MNKRTTRRGLLSAALVGMGGIGLRALATGLPARMLLDPLTARADELTPAKILVLLNSRAGDPIGNNVPGTYIDGVVHPGDPTMAPTTITLDGQPHTAAAPWATLPQEILDQTCFIHHATRTNGHSNHEKVLRLLGAVDDDEMSISLFSKHLAESLGTIQAAPVALGDTKVSFEGRNLARVSPKGLKSALARTDGPLGALQTLRDADLDRIHNIYRAHGTPEQSAMLDRYAVSREQSRQISEDLLQLIGEIEDDNEQGQALAAPVLAAMNVTPVICVRFGFGGDNHKDEGLVKEAEETVTGMEALNTLLDGLATHRASGALQHDVIVASLNVFGRTLELNGEGGRDHNGLHHAMIMMGSGVKAGVVGSISRKTQDWGADPIDSVTGAGGEGGDIPVEESLGAVGKTLGAALGVPRDVINANILQGRVIEAALGS